MSESEEDILKVLAVLTNRMGYAVSAHAEEYGEGFVVLGHPSHETRLHIAYRDGRIRTDDLFELLTYEGENCEAFRAYMEEMG